MVIGWEISYKKELYFISRNLIIFTFDVLSTKSKNTQLEMSSGSWKCRCGAPEWNGDRAHLNPAGAGSLDEDVVPREAAGRKEHSAWANTLETNGETVERGPVKDTESSPSAEKQGL